MRTHLVTCFVCCRYATCRRLIRAGDIDVCKGPRTINKSVTALLAGECLEGDLLGAAPTKAAALITPLPLAAVALLVTGTFGLALASGSWGTGAATGAWQERRHAIKLQSSCR